MTKNFISFSFQPLFSSIAGDVCLLNDTAWLASIQALHALARKGSGDKSAAFLLPRDDAYYLSLLNQEKGFMLGLLANGALVAIAALVIKNNLVMARKDGMLTFPEGLVDEESVFGSQKISVVQSICVSPFHQKKGYATHLLQTALILAQEKGCAHILSQVASHNAIGRRSFKKNGFSPLCVWQKEQVRILFHRDIAAVANDLTISLRTSRRA